MPRLHLVELEDLPWMPRAWRDGATDVLDVLFALTRTYEPAVPRLEAFMQRVGLRRWFDLCSGAGGGAVAMRRAIAAAGGAPVELTLTDRYPNAPARARLESTEPALDAPRSGAERRGHSSEAEPSGPFWSVRGGASLGYLADPVDARRAPSHAPAIRTMFGALHHFRPAEVQGILEDAVRAAAPLAFVDVAASPTLRRLPVVLLPIAAAANVLLLFVAVLLLTPRVRPFRWSRVFWTYLVPAVPALFAWDGTVSALRAYTPEELLALARGVPGAEEYEWEADRAGRSLCLTGRPMA